MVNTALRVLTLDIENFPCVFYSWGMGEVHLPLDFLVRDYTICAWSAKWLDSDEIIYKDNRNKKDIYDDKELVKGLIKLINEADIVVGQNVRGFDLRKVASRADFHKLKAFKPVRVIDILTEERRVFAHTSHKLAFKTRRNLKYQKLEHKEFPGFDLWVATMANILKGWKAMQEYCCYDVLSTEERFIAVKGWIRIPAMFQADGVTRCPCGSTNLQSRGFAHTDAGKFQVYLCKDCGKWPRSSTNLLTKLQKSARLKEVR